MNNSFIQEAFKQVYLTEDAEELSLDAINPDNTESFLDMVNGAEDDEMISDVYDLEAEAKEDLKQSYIGKVILDCNVCHSNVFFDKEEITQDEDGICCTDVECPYCMSNEGYTIIGEVKPYEETSEEEPIEVDVTLEEPEEELPEDEEDTESEEELEEGLKADEVKELRGDEEINGADGPLNSELDGCDEIRGPKYTELNEAKKQGTPWVVESDVDGEIARVKTEREAKATISELKREDKKLRKGKKVEYSYRLDESLDECGDPQKLEECGEQEIEEGIEGTIGGKLAGKAVGTAIGGPVGGAVGSFVGGKIGDKVQDTFSEGCEDKKELEEGIEDATITTEDETVTMTTKEDGGVVVETSPKEDEVEEFSGEEMIAPIEPETESDVEDVIEVNSEDEEEIPEEDELDFEEEPTEEGESEGDFEEFDEDSFDELGESYLKRCYENVTSFKTSNITLNENKDFIIEGKIGFDSGNEKNTQFIFSPKTSENGKLKLEGYNKQISNGKKTFKLNCSINDKSLVCESLNYNYKGKNDLNESVRVYGTVKRK